MRKKGSVEGNEELLTPNVLSLLYATLPKFLHPYLPCHVTITVCNFDQKVKIQIQKIFHHVISNILAL